MNFLKKIYYVYFSKYGLIYNKLNLIASFILHFKKILLKKKKFTDKINFISNSQTKQIVSEINDKGFYLTNINNFNINFNIAEHINPLKFNNGHKTEKKFFENLYNFKKNDEISKFSINKNLIKVVSTYLNTLPILNNIQLIKSDKIQNDYLYSSMNWHLDNHHRKLLKIILLPFDLDGDSGPTCFLDKNTTNELLKKNIYFKSPRYFSDQEIENIDKNFRDKIFSFTGKSGDLLIVDTSKCLHMGSRCIKERYQLFITYTPIETNNLKTLESMKTYNDLNNQIENLEFI